MKTDSRVTEQLKCKRKSFDESISPNIDRRGKNLRPCPHKVDHEIIRQHINSYNPSISHYSRGNAPSRRYLNPDNTVKQMWVDFAEKNPAGGGYQIYFNVFQEVNIGFSRPSADDCEICLIYEEHINNEDVNGDVLKQGRRPYNEDMNEDVLKQGRSDNALLGQEINVQHEKMSCNICVSHAAHRQKYTDARFEYQREKDPEAVYFTADMQKVIVLPKLTTKAQFFVSRLVTFNETFASMNSEFPDYCILWHEAISGRNACDVASYMKLSEIIVQQDSRDVVIWADNCSGQNKNWFLFTSIVQCVNTWGPNSITMKYFWENIHINEESVDLAQTRDSGEVYIH